MLTSFNEAYKTWIYAKNADDKVPVAQLVDFVINPETGIFEAFWVSSISGLKLVSAKDIALWTEDEIVITDEHAILDPQELPRIAKVIEKEIPILGAPVFSGKMRLGEVKDFAFDTISPRILSLTVYSGFWIFGEKQIILRKQIQKITKKGIFVTAPTIKVELDKEPLEKTKKPVADLGEQIKEGKY